MTAILRTALLTVLAAALIPAVAAGQDTSTADLLHRIEFLERANADLERRVREVGSLIKSAPSKGAWSEPGTRGGVDGGVLDQALYAGIGGVTNPEPIEATKVPPRYPDAARKARSSGRVSMGPPSAGSARSCEAPNGDGSGSRSPHSRESQRLQADPSGRVASCRGLSELRLPQDPSATCRRVVGAGALSDC